MRVFAWVMTFVLLGAATVFSMQLENMEDYTFYAGPGGWATSAGHGLIGMMAEVEYQTMGFGVLVGIGTNRVQGWSLLPRIYVDAPDAWRLFGEMPLIQVVEAEISIVPDVGLVKDVYTWQYIGIGFGAEYEAEGRTLKASVGFGATSGQCLPCLATGYVGLQIGFKF
jgi:hypothetical protein